MKKIYLILLLTMLVFPFIGVGSAILTKEYEIKLKQDMVSQNTKKAVRMIGVYASDFNTEMNQAKTEYEKEYGESGFEIINYNGYTLLIPPNIGIDIVFKTKEYVDNVVFNQNNNIPNLENKTSQIAKIRDVFDVVGAISYNATLGAYTDQNGFQYNFEKGELISKQIGITSALNTIFEKTYPHFKSGIPRDTKFSVEQARAKADQVVSKLFTTDHFDDLKTDVKYVDLGDARAGFIYGDKKVHVLIDQVTGDVINLNKTN